jgi:Zn-dependent peptidase ImmA (M78 family)
MKKTVKINNAIYTIQEIHDIRKIYTDGKNKDFYGLCDYTKRTITIKKDLAKDLKRDTLVHELTHAFLFEHGHDSRQYSLETVCNMFGAFAENIVAIVNDYFNNKEKK